LHRCHVDRATVAQNESRIHRDALNQRAANRILAAMQ